MRILVPEAQAMGSVACIRALGRAGHEVVAMARDPSAQGLFSRYCMQRIVQPELGQEAFSDWLLEKIKSEAIDALLPSEALVSLLGSKLHKLAPYMPIGPEPMRLQRFMSKFNLFELFIESPDSMLRRNLPDTRLLRTEGDWRSQLRELSGPLFAKFDAVAERGLDPQVLRFDDACEAEQILDGLLKRYRRGLLQAFAPGQGIGVFFLRWHGEIRASLMHRRLHEVPHTGGVSSYRETWWNEAVHRDAVRRIEALDWWGVGMLEYRWDPGDGSFRLMEFNARFWGSLHLALFAGVDFPNLLLRAWKGESFPPVTAPAGIRCRYTFPKEVEYLWSLVRDPSIELTRKLNALVEFVGLGLDPHVHADLWYPGDRGLYWRALFSTPRKFLRRA